MILRRCALACFCLVIGLYTVRHPESAAGTAKAILAALIAASDALARVASAF